MQRSDQINELAAALAKAQGEMPNAKKDSENPFYHSRYADLAECTDSCRPALSRNGLAVLQGIRTTAEGNVEVETMVAHCSGQWVSETLTMPGTMKGRDGQERFDSQSVGSNATFGRRYGLALVGVVSEDDDGNAAVTAQQRNGASLREKHLPKLEAAARHGLAALSEAWKGIDDPQIRAALANDKDRLKKEAQSATPAA